jgi:hypothetical protein
MSKPFGLWVGGLALVAMGSLVPSALAAKPPGGGGTGGGTIYFAYAGVGWSMASDGSAKSPLPPDASGVPAYLLHGGQRWFLAGRADGGTNPDGTPHSEVFAISQDGLTSVQVTSAPALKIEWTRWGKDDTFFSLSAVDWSVPGAPVSVLGRVALTWDGGGTPSVSGPIAYVATLPSAEPMNGVVHSLIRSHDWSPTGDRVAWNDATANPWVVKVTTTASGGTTTLVVGGYPSWSPDGSKIAFSNGEIWVVSPDGTGLTRVLRRGPRFSVGWPEWSPTGSHLVYLRDDWSVSPRQLDIYRATASGSSPTNLTPDISSAGPVSAWR